jgi:hypothetical protein
MLFKNIRKAITSIYKSAKIARLLLYICISQVLTACAVGLVHHSFDFNSKFSDPDVEILDFKYGGSKPSVQAPQYLVNQGQLIHSGSSTGLMRRPISLYVKWRLKSSGLVYEQQIDLKDRLPSDIEHHIITFLINKSGLNIYLVLPERRPDDWPIVGPILYKQRKVLQIYPTNG